MCSSECQKVIKSNDLSSSNSFSEFIMGIFLESTTDNADFELSCNIASQPEFVINLQKSPVPPPMSIKDPFLSKNLLIILMIPFLDYVK